MTKILPPPIPHRRREDSRHEIPTRDPFRADAKPSQPASCSACGLVFRDGRWQEGARPPNAVPRLCPACRRIEGRHPAGEVRLSGPFFAAHRQAVLATIRRVAAREAAGHPLEKVAEIRDEGDAIVAITTGTHVARAMGQALRAAWDGVLEIEDDDAELGIRVRWSR
ncbi:MAG TPA: BCAM0308 family protein [Candidatus Polarisedimenticolaceae bacterium]|nr:BCAM0308 family protein [Candidatus Polarisedimenticolaceae bacterium]